MLNFRKKLFWLSSKSIRNQYKIVKLMLNNSNVSEVDNIVENNLNKLIKHAVKTTDYYKKYDGFETYKDLPIINKNIIRNNYNKLISSNYRREKLKSVTTSGSTGAPLTVLQDRNKRIRHNAENIYLSEIAGYEIGYKLFYLRVWNEINKKSFIERYIQNIEMVDCRELSDKKIEDIFKQLAKGKCKKGVLGFASSLEAIANYIYRNNTAVDFNFKLDSIISISESLTDNARKVLTNYFGCPVISRYSNMENGFIAQQCNCDNGEYHINRASFFVELLSLNSDEPVKNNDYGRIVITDLFNYSMPFIRYDTGDVAIMSEDSKCGKPGPVFKKIEGRKVDFIFDTNHNLLSPHVITNTMWRYVNEIKQFQFIQESQYEYRVILNCTNNKTITGNKIITDIKSMIGTDAQITLEYVNDIPVLESGKRKKIINNYKTN